MKQRGAVALETILVIALWFIIIFLFLNILFMLSAAALAQSGINRFAIETASLGCMPPNATRVVQDKIPTFASEIQGVEAEVWPSQEYSDGLGGEVLADCLDEETGELADLGDPIRVVVRYQQNILLPNIFLPGEDFLEVSRSATATSSRIESGDLE